MKKIKKILIGIAIILIAYVSYATVTGDPILWIGKGTIRYDLDSNYIRFNYKIARELNAQPFELSSPLTWSTTAGLSFSGSIDSLSMYRLRLYKDSIAGENQWFKYYTLKRPSFNIYDSTVLVWKFVNTLHSTTAEWYAINTYQEYSSTTTIHTLSDNSLPALYTLTLPHDGLWRIEAFFDYEFALDSIVNYGTEDSIIVALETREPPTDNLWIKKVYNPYNTKFGEKGTGYVSIVAPSGTTLVGFYAWATFNAQNAAGEIKRYLSKVRINYELIQ